jgi:DNA-binding CsgD family transcriptional regulator
MRGQAYIKKSDSATWSKRNRRIAALVKSGKTLAEISDEVGVSKERVRQLLRMIGAETSYKKLALHRRRVLTVTELSKVERLVRERLPVEIIARRLELDEDYLNSVIAERGFKRRYRCAICGAVFDLAKNCAKTKYCTECSLERTRQRNAKLQKERYRTDPEFKRKKTEINNTWKWSAAGKKWLAEHRKRSGGPVQD